MYGRSVGSIAWKYEIHGKVDQNILDKLCDPINITALKCWIWEVASSWEKNPKHCLKMILQLSNTFHSPRYNLAMSKAVHENKWPPQESKEIALLGAFLSFLCGFQIPSSHKHKLHKTHRGFSPQLASAWNHKFITIILYSVHACSNLASQRVYSSMLSFTVPDINSAVSKLMALGAELDGPIKYEIHGKVLSLYSHDFHLCISGRRIIYMTFPVSSNAGCSTAMHRWAHARPVRASLKNSCHNESIEKFH